MRYMTHKIGRGAARCAPTNTFLFVLVLLAFASTSFAQDTTIPDDEVNAVAQQMYCPVCENIPLDVCPTAACAQWRDEIRAQLEAGQTPQQIMDDFVERFGERVIGTPQEPTLRALSLLTPWLIGIVAVIVAGLTLARWRDERKSDRQIAPSGTPAASGTLFSEDDYRARIERDLQARR